MDGIQLRFEGMKMLQKLDKIFQYISAQQKKRLQPRKAEKPHTRCAGEQD